MRVCACLYKMAFWTPECDQQYLGSNLFVIYGCEQMGRHYDLFTVFLKYRTGPGFSKLEGCGLLSARSFA